MNIKKITEKINTDLEPLRNALNNINQNGFPQIDFNRIDLSNLPKPIEVNKILSSLPILNFQLKVNRLPNFSELTPNLNKLAQLNFDNLPNLNLEFKNQIRASPTLVALSTQLNLFTSQNFALNLAVDLRRILEELQQNKDDYEDLEPLNNYISSVIEGKSSWTQSIIIQFIIFYSVFYF